MGPNLYAIYFNTPFRSYFTKPTKPFLSSMRKFETFYELRTEDKTFLFPCSAIVFFSVFFSLSMIYVVQPSFCIIVAPRYCNERTISMLCFYFCSFGNCSAITLCIKTALVVLIFTGKILFSMNLSKMNISCFLFFSRSKEY